MKYFKKLCVLVFLIFSLSMLSNFVVAADSSSIGDSLYKVFGFVENIGLDNLVQGSATTKSVFFARFLIWIFLFGVLNYFSKKIFAEQKNIATVISVALSLIGVLGIPSKILVDLFQLYGMVTVFILYGLIIFGSFMLGKTIRTYAGEGRIGHLASFIVYALILVLFGSMMGAFKEFGLKDIYGFFGIVYIVLFIYLIRHLAGMFQREDGGSGFGSSGRSNNNLDFNQSEKKLKQQTNKENKEAYKIINDSLSHINSQVDDTQRMFTQGIFKNEKNIIHDLDKISGLENKLQQFRPYLSKMLTNYTKIDELEPEKQADLLNNINSMVASIIAIDAQIIKGIDDFKRLIQESRILQQQKYMDWDGKLKQLKNNPNIDQTSKEKLIDGIEDILVKFPGVNQKNKELEGELNAYNQKSQDIGVQAQNVNNSTELSSKLSSLRNLIDSINDGTRIFDIIRRGHLKIVKDIEEITKFEESYSEIWGKFKNFIYKISKKGGNKLNLPGNRVYNSSGSNSTARNYGDGESGNKLNLPGDRVYNTFNSNNEDNKGN